MSRDAKTETLSGELQQVLFSPKGGIEGATDESGLDIDSNVDGSCDRRCRCTRERGWQTHRSRRIARSFSEDQGLHASGLQTKFHYQDWWQGAEARWCLPFGERCGRECPFRQTW